MDWNWCQDKDNYELLGLPNNVEAEWILVAALVLIESNLASGSAAGSKFEPQELADWLNFKGHVQ